MREALAPLCGKRGSFVATFKRTGKTSGRWRKLTRLFVNIRHGDREVTSHVWFKESKQWKRLDLQPGDVVHFTATVTTYEKGYKGRRDHWGDDDDDHAPLEIDYKLAFPKAARIVSRADGTKPEPPNLEFQLEME